LMEDPLDETAALQVAQPVGERLRADPGQRRPELGEPPGALQQVSYDEHGPLAVDAQGLLDDAELMSAAARRARAYALAALAVEEAGKAGALFTLALMPRPLRARAPLGRLLQCHQLKLVGGMLIAVVPFGPRTIVAQLLAMPAAQVAEILDNAQALAQDVDCLKQRGLYADIDSGGRVRLPSEVADTDVAETRAR
jgi:AbiV family abortive infection protein